MSALHPKADMCSALAHVRFVPIADIALFDDLIGAGERRQQNSAMRMAAARANIGS